MSYFFLLLALLIAVIDWIAVAQNWKQVEYFAKPGVMATLLIWLWQVSGLAGPLVWFALGLLFSMAGDVFLMLPREQFIAGLVAFLLAHLAYLVGFNTTPPPANAASFILALMVGLVGAQLYRRIADGLSTSGHNQLRRPVFIYSTAISLMLLSALFTLVRGSGQGAPAPDNWLAGPALLVSAGALLFFISDIILAWNKFVAPLPYGRLRVIITYHLGQILLVLGAALHFLAL